MKTAIVHFAKTLLAITLLVPTVTLAQITVYSYQSGNFNAPNIWTYTNGGVDFVTDPLDPNWNYVINPGHTITLTANSQIVQTTGTVTINGTLNVQTFTTQTFGRLLGNGTLRINTAGNPFPNVNVQGSNFLQTGGGTVQYEGGTYTLPNNLTTYNNLTIAGTGEKSFAPTSATIFTLNGNLTVNTGATLTIGGTGTTVVTLNISGNLTVNSGATLNVGNASGQVQHAINLSGNLTNSGTIDLTNLTQGADPFAQTSTGGSARIRFTGATDNTVTLNVGHSTQFGNFIVNKGTGQTNVLHVIVQAGALNPQFWGNGGTTTPGGQRFVITNGILRLGANITISDLVSSGSPNYDLGGPETGASPGSNTALGENGQLWNDGATIQASGNALVVYGTYRQTAGSITCENEGLVVRGTGSVIIEGGVVNAEKFRPSTIGASTPRGSFRLLGGTVNINASFPGSSNNGYARFCMPYLDQVFIMTGGTLNIADPETGGTAVNGLIDIRCLPSNISVTGGTINVTIPASGEARISSTAPFPNFNVNKAGEGTAELVLQQIGVNASGSGVGATTARPLTVLGDFTIQTGYSPLFNANNQDVTIGGTLNVQSGTTFRTGTNTVTFIGDGSDFITINGTLEVNQNSPGFNNLTVNRTSGTLFASQSFSVRGTLTLLGSAPLNDNGFNINVIGNVVNSGVHQSTGSGRIVLVGSSTQTIGGNGSGQFGNLTLNNASNPGATLTANQTINGTLTLASSTCIFNIDIYRLRINNGNTNAIQPTGGFSASRYIRVTANPTVPGLERYITGTGNYLFPIGEVDGTTNKYTPAEVNINTFTDDGYIAINPVDQILATTNSAGGADILSYYWRVRRSGFSSAPTVSMRFTYHNNDIGGNEANYVPGRVLDQSPFARSTDGGTDDVDDANNQAVFNGPSTNATFPGAGFTLNVNANYTAGAAGRFTGTPTVYYSRNNAPGIGSYNAYPGGAPRWHDPSTWSTSSHDGPAANTVPGPGDIVIIGPPSGDFHHVVVRGNPINTPVTAECAELRFNSPTGDPEINYGPRLTVFPNCTANLTAVKNASGTAGEVMIFFNNSQFPNFNADLTEWSDGTGLFIYQMQEDNASGRLFPPTGLPTVYPNLRFEGADGNNRVMILPSENWTVKQNCFIDHHAIVRLNAGTNGDLTIDKDLRLGRPTATRAGRLEFPGGTATNIRTLTIGRDLLFGGEATSGGQNALVVQSGSANVEHRLRVGRDIRHTLYNPSDNPVNQAELDLFTGANEPRAVLELFSTQNGIYDKAGNNADLWRIEMNKGTDTTATFSVNRNTILTTGAMANNSGSTKFLTLLNGRFILNATGLTFNLSSGGAPFQIPPTAGLILQNGTATVTGDGTGILLDGLLRIDGGTLDAGDGTTPNTRYIEFGSSGNARLQLWNGTVRVNSQIRRSPFTTAGVLKYVQHGGSLTIHGQGALASRAKFDVPENAGSEFTMTGGTITLVRGGGTSYGDLYLRPPTASVTGGTIILNATGAGSNQTFDIDCNIALNDLTITGSAGNDATGRLRINPLTLTNSLTLSGTLTISNNRSIFDANGLDVFIGGNLINNNTSTDPGLNVGGYRPQTATQTTTFNRAGAQSINSTTPVLGNLTNFANLVLTGGSGTLTLTHSICVNSNLTINAGKTLNDGGNAVIVIGNVTHNGTHTGTGSITLAGSVQQQLFGTGTYQNLTLNNSAGAKTNANTTVASVLTLTNGILDIGSNLLSLTNTGTAVSGTFSNTRMIRTNGNNADQGVQKSYPAGASNFLFPIGTGTRYTPARLNVTATGAAGTIRVVPVNNVHPGVEFGANVLRYYWIVRSTGFSNPTVQHSYNAPGDGGDATLPVTGTPDRVGRLNPDLSPPNWDPIDGFAPGSGWTYNNTNRSITTTTGVNYINGDYTAGTSAEFSSIPVYTSIASGFWENQATWTTSPPTNTPPRAGSNVIINNGHTVTTQPNAIISVSINNGGSGYDENDVLSVSGGTGGQVRVEQVGPDGVITRISLINGGTGYTTATNVATSGGSGIGATVNIVASLGKVGNSVTINSGGTLDLGNTIGHNFSTIAGQGTLRLTPTNGGSYVFPGGSATGFLSSGGGTVEYSGSTNGDLPPAPTSYNNIRFSNSAGSTASYPNVDLTLAGNLTVDGGGTVSNPDNRNITVGGDFNISGGSTYNAGNGTLSIGGNFTGSGTYTFNANGATMPITGRFTNTGTFNANTSTITISGADGGGSNYSFANTGTFNAGTGTVIFGGGSAQTLGGSLTTFNNLTINKSSNNLTLAGSTNQQVNGTLTLTNGNIITGSNALILGSTSAVAGGGNSSYVEGNIGGIYTTTNALRTYPFGSGGLYRRIGVRGNTSTGTATLLGSLINASAYSVTSALSGLTNVSTIRYYQFQNSGQALTVTQIENFRGNTDDDIGSFASNNTLRIGTAVSDASPVWTGRTLLSVPNTTTLPIDISTQPFSQSVAASGSGSTFYAALASISASDNPLPVELISFAITAVDEGVKLKWETASEVENAGFIVSRSRFRDGGFEELASYRTHDALVGKGTSTTGGKYEWIDKSKLLPGETYYYKLEDVDFNGVIHTVEVKEFTMPKEYSLSQNYPNPFNSSTVVEFNLRLPGRTVLEVYNVLGQRVMTVVDGELSAGSYRYQVNMSGMASGMYLYRLRSRDFVATKKMLLIK